MDSVSPARMMAILFSAARPAKLKRWRFMVLLAGIALSGAAAAQEAIEEVYGAESGEIVLVPTGDAVLSGLP
ncbi:MAG: hypothetical protein OXG39_07615, partial [Chloroflexi bacterium]|nr:hypothetical protein [Chloroflexota bacterium]